MAPRASAAITRAGALPQTKGNHMPSGFYVASFPFPTERGEEFTVIELRDGLIFTTADGGEGPQKAELSDYVPIRRIDLAA
jgi:hypothetical protein